MFCAFCVGYIVNTGAFACVGCRIIYSTGTYSYTVKMPGRNPVWTLRRRTKRTVGVGKSRPPWRLVLRLVRQIGFRHGLFLQCIGLQCPVCEGWSDLRMCVVEWVESTEMHETGIYKYIICNKSAMKQFSISDYLCAHLYVERRNLYTEYVCKLSMFAL